MITPSETTSTLGALEATLSLGIESADTILIQTTGTWVGTISPEVSLDGVNYVAAAVQAANQTNSVTMVTSFTTNNIHKLFASGFPFFRLRMSAYTSGTATVIVHGDRQAK